MPEDPVEGILIGPISFVELQRHGLAGPVEGGAFELA